MNMHHGWHTKFVRSEWQVPFLRYSIHKTKSYLILLTASSMLYGTATTFRIQGCNWCIQKLHILHYSSASPVLLRSMDVQLTIQKVHKYLRDVHKPSLCVCELMHCLLAFIFVLKITFIIFSTINKITVIWIRNMLHTSKTYLMYYKVIIFECVQNGKSLYVCSVYFINLTF